MSISILWKGQPGNRKVTKMGACDFGQIEFGKTVDDAYQKACDEALYESGHDAYNGTISTTHGFVMFKYNAHRDLWKQTDELIEKSRKIEKWGRCGAMILTGKRAVEYKKRNGLKGKRGVVVCFFGMAAC